MCNLFLTIMLLFCVNSIKFSSRSLIKTQSNRTLFPVENYNYLLIPKRIVMNRTVDDKVLINIKILIR